MPTKHGKADKGSQKWLQILVNDRTELLNREISCQSTVEAEEIRWLSPLRRDNYREYYDRQFLDLLEIELENRPLESFWPSSGPRWDGLAKTARGQILLVEAKSHVGELVSSTGASTSSLAKIRSSLAETKRLIHRDSDYAVDWTTGVYQYANRLAHLYLLHKLNGHDVYLVLVYFLNDSERQKPDTHVPATVGEWKSVIAHQDRIMGIRQRHPLSDRIIHVYIDVNDVEASA